MKVRRKIGCVTAAICILSGTEINTARAGDIQVNTYTTGSQNRPSVALDAGGDFVVVWGSFGSAGTDTDAASIQGQRNASNGSAIGSQFQVNTFTTNSQGAPSVASDADGDFVVVWHGSGSSGTDLSSTSIHGQRYASDGSAMGIEFQVNTYTTSSQFNPSVASDADGDFVVVWRSNGSSGTDSGRSIQGQRYSSDGSAMSGEFQVNTYTTNGQYYPSAAMDEDGNFVVVWRSIGSSSIDPNFSILGQRYASNGSTVNDEFLVNAYTTSSQLRPSVALDADGDFVVVWYSFGSTGTDSSVSSIQGQRFASDGSAEGGQFQVNTYTTGYQRIPSVAVAADGDFVVVWRSDGSGGGDLSGLSIQGQRYSSGGSPVSGEFQVNTYTTDNQDFPSVSLDANGDFVVVWQSDGSSGTDTHGYSIQRTPVRLIFADGFESGDTSAWQ